VKPCDAAACRRARGRRRRGALACACMHHGATRTAVSCGLRHTTPAPPAPPPHTHTHTHTQPRALGSRRFRGLQRAQVGRAHTHHRRGCASAGLPRSTRQGSGGGGSGTHAAHQSAARGRSSAAGSSGGKGGGWCTRCRGRRRRRRRRRRCRSSSSSSSRLMAACARAPATGPAKLKRPRVTWCHDTTSLQHPCTGRRVLHPAPHHAAAARAHPHTRLRGALGLRLVLAAQNERHAGARLLPLPKACEGPVWPRLCGAEGPLRQAGQRCRHLVARVLRRRVRAAAGSLRAAQRGVRGCRRERGGRSRQPGARNDSHTQALVCACL
jgi:hypothetical protein